LVGIMPSFQSLVKRMKWGVVSSKWDRFGQDLLTTERSGRCFSCGYRTARPLRVLHSPLINLWKKADYLDDAILSLDDFDRVAGNFQAGAGFRNIFEMIEYQAVERFCAV
jgi:hypothetical protein